MPEVSPEVFVKFLLSMESRLAIILTAKVPTFSSFIGVHISFFISQEQVMRLPMSQRMLFASLFYEIRLYTRSLKPYVELRLFYA